MLRVRLLSKHCLNSVSRCFNCPNPQGPQVPPNHGEAPQAVAFPKPQSHGIAATSAVQVFRVKLKTLKTSPQGTASGELRNKKTYSGSRAAVDVFGDRVSALKHLGVLAKACRMK